MLDMGPVLPNTPEGDVQEVTVLNEGAWDVEIFSLDFDKVTATKHQHLLAVVEYRSFLALFGRIPETFVCVISPPPPGTLRGRLRFSQALDGVFEFL